MSTNSTIAAVLKDGTVKSIYCHWDGQVDNGVGRLLVTHYKDLDVIEELLSLGNLSSLGAKVNPESDTHSYDTPEEDVCVFYHRDRDEPFLFVKPNEYENLIDYLRNNENEEYNYLFVNGEWILINEKFASVESFLTKY